MKTTIELDQLQSVYDAVADQWGNVDYTELLQDEHVILEKAHREYFTSQSNPAGEAWPENAPSTIKRKGHGIVLFETSRLMRSLTSPDAEDAIRDIQKIELFHGSSFGTSVPYSIYHQEPTLAPGGSGMKRREHVGMNEGLVNGLATATADETVRQLKE